VQPEARQLMPVHLEVNRHVRRVKNLDNLLQDFVNGV